MFVIIAISKIYTKMTLQDKGVNFTVASDSRYSPIVGIALPKHLTTEDIQQFVDVFGQTDAELKTTLLGVLNQTQSLGDDNILVASQGLTDKQIKCIAECVYRKHGLDDRAHGIRLNGNRYEISVMFFRGEQEVTIVNLNNSCWRYRTKI